jgi:hypothetical protein
MRCVGLCDLKIKSLNECDKIDEKPPPKIYIIKTKFKTVIIKVFHVFWIDLKATNFSPE